MVQHISIRVPWTDNGFIGRICDCPLKNYACRRLKAIAETNSLLCQEQGQSNVDLCDIKDSEKRSKLPCLTEGRAFMSDKDITTECYHNYSMYNYDSHRDFIPSKLIIPAYTLVAHPYRWLRRGNNEDGEKIRELNDIPDRDGEIAHLLLKNQNRGGSPVGQNWVQHPETQKRIFETFFKHVVPNKSLCFIYAKSVPYIENSDRILMGIAVVDKEVRLPQKHAKRADASSPLESFSWECMVAHKIRQSKGIFLSDDNGVFGGFLFPYAQFIEKIETAKTIKEKEAYIKVLQAIAVSIPEDFREEFSYATEHVSNDAAIYMLLKAEKALSAIIDLGYIHGNLVDCRLWVQQELDFLWKDRPIYPGLGNALAAVGINVANNIVANEINEKLRDNPQAEMIDLLTSWIRNGTSPAGIYFTRSDRMKWEEVASDYRKSESFKRIARVYVSFKQADCLWRKVQSNGINLDKNPYALYTSNMYEEAKKQISLYYIDLAFFVPRSYRAMFFKNKDECVESADDPYRIAGFASYVLANARSEGHTYLPGKELANRISCLDIQEQCIIDENILQQCYKQKYLNNLIYVTQNHSGYFYKLLYFYDLDQKIRALVDERIMAKPMGFDTNDFHINLPAGTPGNPEATAEQIKAMEAISKSAISVLYGPAGTGKTTLLTSLCSSFKNKVLLLAPTGKARVRMQQTLAKDGRFVPDTIAGYLVKLESIEEDKNCYDPETGRYLLPKQPDPKYTDADVIVDESSMLTEEMFGAILAALQNAKRIIFVGDVSQLPPIGAGKPFYELIHKLKQLNQGFAELTIPVRFGGTNPDDLELSKHFSLDRNIRAQADDSVFNSLKETAIGNRLSFIKWDNSDDLRKKLATILQQELSMDSENDVLGFNRSLGSKDGNSFWCGTEYNQKPGIGEFADKWQIITPLRNRFDVGTVGLNAFIHEMYRSEMLKNEIKDKQEIKTYLIDTHPTPLPGDIITGDKVINQINTKVLPVDKFKYRKDDRGYRYKESVANGEIGIVGLVGTFDKSNKRVWVRGIEFASQPMKSFFYTEKDFGDESTPILELAYALTVHKAQGSDFGTVILIMGQHMPLESREMLYTALTRQKNRLVILYNGDIESLKDLKQDSKSSLLTRYSDLFEEAKNIDFDDDTGLYRTNYIYVTDRGDNVKSKSEVIVANALYKHGIEYHYEKPLKLDGYEKAIKPDFTIEYKGRVYYWEHLGMPDDENYRNKWIRKLALYRKNGIEPITSQDIINKNNIRGGIDSKEIENIIKRYFQ